MIEGVKIHDQFIHKDHRGYLLRLVRKEHVSDRIFGDSYIVSSIPGVVRGNHFHKRTTEWFCLIKGKGCLGLKKGKEIDFLAEMSTELGPLKVFIKAKDKKKINDADLALIHSSYPIVLLTSGELTKKAKEYIQSGSKYVLVNQV